MCSEPSFNERTSYWNLLCHQRCLSVYWCTCDISTSLPVGAVNSNTSFPHNGGYIYYLINVVIALIGLIAFTITARRYQYRQRDEPDNIYRYAEEYYANSQDEPNYDYDDYDNLNCETINK